MTEEKAKEICKQFVEENKARPIVLHEAIEIILAELVKKDKIIDELAYEISEEDENFQALHIKEIIQYFERKVKNGN